MRSLLFFAVLIVARVATAGTIEVVGPWPADPPRADATARDLDKARRLAQDAQKRLVPTAPHAHWATAGPSAR